MLLVTLFLVTDCDGFLRQAIYHDKIITERMSPRQARVTRSAPRRCGQRRLVHSPNACALAGPTSGRLAVAFATDALSR